MHTDTNTKVDAGDTDERMGWRLELAMIGWDLGRRPHLFLEKRRMMI